MPQRSHRARADIPVPHYYAAAGCDARTAGRKSLSPGEQLPVSLVLVRGPRRKPETHREHARAYSAIELYLSIIAHCRDIARENAKKKALWQNRLPGAAMKGGCSGQKSAVRQERFPKPVQGLVWAAVASNADKNGPGRITTWRLSQAPDHQNTGPAGMWGSATFRLGHAIPGIRRYRVPLSSRQAR